MVSVIEGFHCIIFLPQLHPCIALYCEPSLTVITVLFSMISSHSSLLELIGSIGKQYIVWQEIFDNGLKVLPDTVIHVWKGSWQKEAFNVTKAGLKTIISSCWYLNRIHFGVDWPDVSLSYSDFSNYLSYACILPCMHLDLCL